MLSPECTRNYYTNYNSGTKHDLRDSGYFLKLKNNCSHWRQYSTVVLLLLSYAHNYAAQIHQGQAAEYFREILIYTSAWTLSREDEKLERYYNKAGTNGRAWHDSTATKDNENLSRWQRRWLSSHGNNIAFIKLKNICSCPWQIFLIVPHKGWETQNCFFFPRAFGSGRTQESLLAFFGLMLTLVRRTGAREMWP